MNSSERIEKAVWLLTQMNPKTYDHWIEIYFAMMTISKEEKQKAKTLYFQHKNQNGTHKPGHSESISEPETTHWD